ncbi:hypothetical protein VCRA211O406_330002 [Vibrio crassostreae]|nr:hypothetical protein VCRA211O406_330002 [Vibrio crassostreae]
MSKPQFRQEGFILGIVFSNKNADMIVGVFVIGMMSER